MQHVVSRNVKYHSTQRTPRAANHRSDEDVNSGLCPKQNRWTEAQERSKQCSYRVWLFGYPLIENKHEDEHREALEQKEPWTRVHEHIFEQYFVQHTSSRL